MKRLRLLIYDCENKEQLDKQIARSIQGTRFEDYAKPKPISITAIDLDPFRITILQLIRLFIKESKNANTDVETKTNPN